MDNRTTPQPRRSGFVYPRLDARLHHGDEVQFKSPGQHWLGITDDPSFALLGRTFDLQEVATGRYCGLASRGAAVSCGHESPPRSSATDGGTAEPRRRRFEVVTAGHHVALRAGEGRFCSDRPSGVSCSSRAVSSWERFEFVVAGGGLVRLRGLRKNRFCADRGRGLACDEPSKEAAPVFRVVADAELRQALVLLPDHSAAAVFVVHREDLDSPMLALYCKAVGLYLAAEEGSELPSCSSSKPWYMVAARVQFSDAPGQPKWDLGSATLRAPGPGRFLAPGLGWSRQGQARFSGRKDVKWKVRLTGGCETLRPLIRGVNLGNWFLIEKWMAASLFSDEAGRKLEDECRTMDEYGLMSLLGPSAGRKQMEQHWSSWITEEDVAWMAGHGVNAVRVPFGYWMVFPTPPFVPGQLKYLERLFQWCEKYSLGVLLDFHGLKGSQTGTPTSGNCGGCGRESCGETWLRFLDEQELNLEVIRRLVVRFSSSPSYLGFAVANEVSSKVDRQELMSFYQRAYDTVRRQDRYALVVFYGTFSPSLYPWDNFEQALVDVHVYFGWGFGTPTVDQHANLLRARRAVAQVHWPVLVGEWSLAANGHQTLSWEPPRRDAFFDRFARMQLQAWETHSTGWFYWSYKTRFHNSTWNYRDMCEVGWVPGCTEQLKFGPGEWWSAPACAYAYLDGQCTEGSTGLMQHMDGELASAAGWLLHSSIVAVLAMAFVAGVMVVRQSWKSSSCRRVSDVLGRRSWTSMPDVECEPIMKEAPVTRARV